VAVYAGGFVAVYAGGFVAVYAGGFVAVFAGGDGLVTAVATYQRDPVGVHYANLVHTRQKLRTSTAQQ
jgi:hypothetical protein